MNDVIVAAAIAGGVGLLGNAATAVVALRTATGHRIAEAGRLHAEHGEADRRVRRDAYAALLLAIEEFDLLTSGYTPDPTPETFSDSLRHLRAAVVAVRLVESAQVRAARKAFEKVLDAVADEAPKNVDKGMKMVDALGYPYVAARGALHDAGATLGNRMREDLAIASDLQDTRPL